MPLQKYKAKRDLKKSHEPQAAVGKTREKHLRFCIQKHDARRLHYDFRLEHNGVLLSWAVPKGPPTDPKEKRLAIHVEDHPLDYQYFEGVIPKGHYGAGTVEIWDKGTYTVEGGEKAITAGLKKGHIDFHLEGEKLEGDFSLIKMHPQEEGNQWLLMKRSEKAATAVVTHEGKPAKMPENIKPMLATLIDKPFDDSQWLFEVKLDGYRALAYLEGGKVELKSRAQNSQNGKFPAIVESLKEINAQAILDGEIVILDDEGRSDFQLMQNYQLTRKGHLFYYVFDLLYLNGKDLRDLPLIERKQLLKKLIPQDSFIRYCGHVEGKGEAFFHEAKKHQLEGIIGKKEDSTYQSTRGRNWVKIKAKQTQELVIGGFTAPRGGREKFGALLVGYYKGPDLIYAGHVGGGFDRKLLNEIYKKLEPLVQSQSPFKVTPKPNSPAKWVTPKLVCQVEFSEWTQESIMRQPVFQGLREDKDPKTVTKEEPQHKPETAHHKDNTPKKSSKKLTLSNLDKVYWPEEGYTKGDLIEYYRSASKYILPYLKDRPIVLYRFPHGITKPGFYQKEVEDTVPSWIKTLTVEHDERTIHYLSIDSVDSLLFAINLGSIDIHPFMSRYENMDRPDYCVIDLDPQDIPWPQFIDVVLETHAVLEEGGVKHFCKTSGGRGIHIVIPFGAKYTTEQSRQFAEIIVHYVNARLPKTTSLERNPKKRMKKVYLDYLQNRSFQTIVAPYTVRPRPHAPVSMPLEWDEVSKDLNPLDFNIKTALTRIKKMGDIYKPILGKGIDIEKALKKWKQA